MQFELPVATAVINNRLAKAVPRDECWDLIGPPLDPAIKAITAFGEKFEFKLSPTPIVKRQEIERLFWGKLSHEADRLDGLAAAIENISLVTKKGKDQLADKWKGKSYDAFTGNVGRLEQVLNEYVRAVKITAQGLRQTVEAIKKLYGDYRTVSLQILNFHGFSPPHEWWKMSGANDADYFSARCVSHGKARNHASGDFSCYYGQNSLRDMLNGKFVNQALRDKVAGWDCVKNEGEATSQYTYLVRTAEEEKSAIERKINQWYVTTDNLVKDVRALYRAALDNLAALAQRNVFQSLSTQAGPPGGGGVPQGGTGVGGTKVQGIPGVGSGSVGSASIPKPIPPMQQVSPVPTPGPVQVPPIETPPRPIVDRPPVAAPPETVTIQDGDRTIKVDSPTGQGIVKISIAEGTGPPKTYDLDFGAGAGSPATGTPGTPVSGAIGMPPGGSPDQARESNQRPGAGQGVPPQPGSPLAGAIPAGEDGKVVVKDGPLTLTAERPPGTPDQVKITVNDGSGPPTTYNLDYADAAGATVDRQPGAPQPGVATGAQPPDPAGAQQQTTSAQGNVTEGGTGQASVPSAGLPGEAGLASAPDPNNPPHGAAPAGMGGMPMMGGAGPGGGGGGDQDRSGGGQWSTVGDLFAEDDADTYVDSPIGED
ncbi:uncharacterized protein YukE [Herbihabitans rhizosphaerae]|uniref:Uncharacterized protein YukE n=1 Tax=Herbihabitans rhizosphaerae TaxID=1872711 RepID=A0A4Q7KKV5_9PSEU|nr:WXG100 family type VII secretion target [Herbihabitans rhizosphaerae]RZS37125.1 uncharacterized protein YukE [Herbihabitans rhizosphaerae]